LITNKVQDDGVTNKEGKGTRNEEIMRTALEQEKVKELAAKSNKK